MAQNTGKLAGKTVFITGSSRGIGKAIALKVAKDGANVVVAARTGEANPNVPGTIYTTAEEVNNAGGKALPLILDVSNEEQVQEAVKQTVEKFGGIDILVNNAEAIFLTDTFSTSIKAFDIMSTANTRGVFLCSKACLPHLLKAENPHILNITPPVNLSPKLFAGFLPYTITKYAVSVCTLGLSEEFRSKGVAVNGLWPRTLIWSAGAEMIDEGGALKKQCRTMDILSDAAYVILSRNSQEFTGNFTIDDEILQSVGVTDLKHYSCVPGNKLAADIYLDYDAEEFHNPLDTLGGKLAF